MPNIFVEVGYTMACQKCRVVLSSLMEFDCSGPQIRGEYFCQQCGYAAFLHAHTFHVIETLKVYLSNEISLLELNYIT